MCKYCEWAMRRLAVEALCVTLAGASEAGSVERRCSCGVQLGMHVLGAAEHAAQAWEVAVGTYQWDSGT